MPSGPRYPGFRSDASAPQGTVQWIDAPEEDVLPRIPGEQTKHEPATRAHDLDGDPHEHVEKRFEFHPEHGGFLSGSRPRSRARQSAGRNRLPASDPGCAAHPAHPDTPRPGVAARYLASTCPHTARGTRCRARDLIRDRARPPSAPAHGDSIASTNPVCCAN